MKIKSIETPRQGSTVVKCTTNQSICSDKSSIKCEIASEIMISDFTKICVTGVLNMPL